MIMYGENGRVKTCSYHVCFAAPFGGDPLFVLTASSSSEKMRYVYLLLALLSTQSVADAIKTLNEDLSHFISSTKAELAQSFFKPKVVKKGITRVNLTEEKDAVIEFPGAGHSGALFRRSKENYIVNGSQIFHLRKKYHQDASSQLYFLDSVQELSVEEGAIIFEQTEWKNVFFLAVCYRTNYCRALMSHPTRSIIFQQKLTVRYTPTDLKFFVADEALFLIVAGDPCKIYRWTGTYFDENEELDTFGANAVATFRDEEATVIVVAQHLPAKQVYSKVFVRKNKKTELIQMLQTRAASDVMPYSLDDGNETLHFIFVLSNVEESAVFWWSGREFTLWKRVNDALGPARISVRKILSHSFLFFARQNELKVYHPTETSFDLIHAIKLDGNIVDVDLREEVDRPPMLLLLKSSDSQSLLTISLLSVDVNHVPLAENQIAVDPVLQCLLQLKKLLQNREAKLNESVLLLNEMGKKSKIIELKNLSVPNVALKSFTINELKVNPSGEKLEATPSEISRKLEKLKEESDSLLVKLESTLKHVRYRFHGDIIVTRMKASNIYAKKFNDRAFDLNNIISVTRNQTLSGAIHLKTLSANSLTLPSISGVYVKDVLLRKKPLQAITGEHTVRSVKARNVIFGRLGKLNGTLFSSMRRFGSASHNTVTEKKTLARMGVTHLQVDYINNEPAKQWLAKILPTTKDFGPQEEAVNFTDMTVTDLVVANINGMAWKDYLMAAKLSGRKGNRSALENVETVRLRTKKINGIEVASFLTKDTPQEIDSTIAVTCAELASVNANLFVGGLESPTSELPRQGPEAMQTSLDVHEIIFKKPVDISGRRLHFDELNQTYWMKSWPQKIDASITVASKVKVNDMETTRINGKAVDNFVASRDAVIQGPVLFEEVTVIGKVAASVDARRNVNLNKLYKSAVKASGENRIKGRKVFLGNVSAEHISIRSLNAVPFGYRLPISTGILVLQHAEIVGNVSVKEGVRLNYLNDRNFSDTILKHVRLNERDVLQKGNYSSVSVKEIEVENINGNPFTNRFTSRNKRNRLRVVITGDLEVQELEVATLNNITLNGYLNKVVSRNGTESFIKGRKSFEKVVTIRGNLDGALNEYDLAELERKALSKSKSQNVTGTFLADVLTANNTDCEVIDGVSTDELLFRDGSVPQAVRSSLLFVDFAIAGNIRSRIFMDGCDLSRMTRLKVNEIKKLGKLDATGNVTWNRDRGNYRGISYLYGHAMKRHEEQIVDGSTVFRGKTAFDKLNTKNNINDVDLQFIVNDAVYGSIKAQEIFNDITFRGKIAASNIFIDNNIIVDNINGIDILDLEQRLVRNNEDIEVRGNKKFLSGFTTHRFVSEALNGVKTKPIIFCDGGRANGSIQFSATAFHSVKTLKDFDVLRVNDVNLSDLLKERLSKTVNGGVKANFRIKGPLSIKGDGGISRINDLNLEDTIPVSEKVNSNSVKGKLEFNNSFTAIEKMEVDSVNGRNVTAMKKRLVLNMTDSVIKGNTIFKGDVEFDGNVEILQQVNGCEIKSLGLMQVPMNLGNREREYAAKIELEMNKIENSSTSFVKPVIFIDLQQRSTIHLPILKVDKINVKYDGDNVELNVYGEGNAVDGCRLNSNCRCRAQKNLVISTPVTQQLTPRNVFPTNYKYLDKNLNVELTVTASDSSSDSRCDDAMETTSEYATLSWRRRNLDGNAEPEGNSTQQNIPGRLSDVQFFTITDSIFVITAFYVRSPKSKMSGLKMMVHEFDGRMEVMKKVQEMGLSGAEALHLFWTPKGVILVAGNGYDSETSVDSVDSAIYRFSDSDNQFRLLRTVKTHGIFHISSIAHDKDSFLFLVQKQSWPLLILKYNHEYDNYYFSQKLDADHSKVKSNFLSAAAFTTARPGYDGDIFVGIVHSDGGFRLFRYKHIEGFVEEMRQEQKNLETLVPFQLHFRHYLFAVSSGNHSVIYELAQQGYLPQP